MKELRFFIFWGLLLVVLASFMHPAAIGTHVKQMRADSIFPVFSSYKINMVSSGDKRVTLTMGVDNDLYFTDSVNKKIHLYIRAQFSDQDSSARLPLNLCIVIDKSGSMEGVKMGNAKKAARAIVDALSATDLVSIVAFDNYVDTILSPVHAIDKEGIKKKINTIVPQGGTNLWGGTSKGYEYARRNIQAGAVNRVLLLSDGGANYGLTDPVQITDSVRFYKETMGITISTFGIGLDFNERLLTEMATVGLGRFYYINQPQQIVTDLTKELTAISRVVVKNSTLKLQLPASLQISSVLPAYVQAHGQTLSIRWNEAFAGDNKELLLYLTYTRRTTTPLIINAILNYTSVSQSLSQTLSGSLTLNSTSQKAVYVTHFDRQVIEKTIFFTASDQLEQAINKTDEGKVTDALSLLKANSDYLGKQKDYAKSSRKLKTLDSLNQAYYFQLENRSGNMPDSLKKLQKIIRTKNYQLKNDPDPTQ